MSASEQERKSVAVDLVKCTDCICVFNAKQGLERDGRVYCSATCADHHKSGAGCKHAGCVCHG
jgi:metallothionein